MPAPRRARARLACGLAATAVAAALALAPLARIESPGREAMAWLAGAALLLAAGAALRAPSLLAPALLALLADHTIVLLQGDDRVHAAAPLGAAGLLLYAELACWAREADPRVHDERRVVATRAIGLAASALAALALAALILLAAALPAGGGLARLTVGVAAATGILALVALVARPTATRAPRR